MTAAALPLRDDRHFEDYVPGSAFEYGSIDVSEEEIIQFAKRFDPQAMHTDPSSTAAASFGGLIASGWHTTGIMMRLLVDHFLPTTASIISPGVDELRWTLPVRPGDTLRIRVTVVDATRSRSKADRGLVRSFIEVINQNGEIVMTLKGLHIFRCRAAAPHAHADGEKR